MNVILCNCCGAVMQGQDGPVVALLAHREERRKFVPDPEYYEMRDWLRKHPIMN